MERRNIDPLIEQIKKCIDRHYLGTPGAYTRYTVGERVDGKINEYGVADAANLLYTINDFRQAQADREHWIKILQGMQDPETGMYHEATHHTIHTTAHCYRNPLCHILYLLTRQSAEICFTVYHKFLGQTTKPF